MKEEINVIGFWLYGCGLDRLFTNRLLVHHDSANAVALGNAGALGNPGALTVTRFVLLRVKRNTQIVNETT